MGTIDPRYNPNEILFIFQILAGILNFVEMKDVHYLENCSSNVQQILDPVTVGFYRPAYHHYEKFFNLPNSARFSWVILLKRPLISLIVAP